MSDAEKNMQVVREYVDAINRWDFDTWGKLLDPDEFTFRIPFRPEVFPGEISGRDQFLEFARQWKEQVDGSENLDNLTVATLAQDSDTVVARYTSDMKMKATGHRYLNSYIGWFRLRNGRIIHFSEYLDSIPLLIAAGGTVTYPQPPEAG
jgi:hypothetical protein